jgi:uracil-DNA glycosylase
MLYTSVHIAKPGSEKNFQINSMNYEKVASQFGEWGPKFKPFIESDAFDEIFKFLKSESAQGKTICPASKDVFRAFRETPYKDLKAIFLLQDPYPWIKNGVMVADGIPMSCSNNKILQPSLELFYEGMEDDLGIKVPRNPDLSYLCNQGVLFLNSSLTVEANKRNSHKGIWDKFNSFLVEEVINFYNTGLCYVSLGEDAKLMTKAITPFLHYSFEVEHPAAAAHHERKWNHSKIFSAINKVIKNNNNHEIKWASDYGQ